MIIEAVMYVLILATSFPVAKLLIWLCEDELQKDRKYFLYLAYFLILAAIGFAVFYFDIPILLSLAYMLLILAFMSYAGKKSKKSEKSKKKRNPKQKAL